MPLPLLALGGIGAGIFGAGALGSIFSAKSQTDALSNAANASNIAGNQAMATQLAAMDRALALGAPFQTAVTLGFARAQQLLIGGDLRDILGVGGLTADSARQELTSNQQKIAQAREQINALTAKDIERGGINEDRARLRGQLQAQISTLERRNITLQGAAPILASLGEGGEGGLLGGPLETSPLFRMQAEEFETGLGRFAAARGMQKSGATLEQGAKGLQRLLAEEAQRQFSQSLQLAQTGAPGLQQGMQGVLSTGQNVAQTQIGVGNVQAQALQQAGLVRGQMFSGLGQLPFQMAGLTLEAKGAGLF